MKEITKETVLTVHSLSPQDQRFAKQKHSGIHQKKNSSSKSFSVKFSETIKKIFRGDTGLELIWKPECNDCCLTIKTDDELQKIQQWVAKQGRRVFIRDCLSASIALDMNYLSVKEPKQYICISSLKSSGKDHQNQSAIGQLSDIVTETIRDLPFYKDADLICSVPPSPDKDFDLPSSVTLLVSTRVNKPDITGGFVFNGQKPSVKSTAFDEKWNAWEGAQVSFQNSPTFNVNDKTVILIDDKYQSGITMQYIAMKLQQAGAKEVYGLSFVKTFSKSANPIRVDYDNDLYPERVKTIMGGKGKAPKPLYMAGNTDLLNIAGLGFCGSRKSSSKGLEVAQDCAGQAAHKNVSVVSGNAAGVDFEAHYHCLKEGGKTILVLPEGINHFKAKEALKGVWDWDRVLVVSQFEPDEPWQSFRAMMRNKLIIALSRVMIAIEVGKKSGTLNTVEEALTSGLPLYVVEYEDMSVDALVNKELLNRGDVSRLTKSRLTNRANLDKVFESMKEDRLLKEKSKQIELPY